MQLIPNLSAFQWQAAPATAALSFLLKIGIMPERRAKESWVLELWEW